MAELSKRIQIDFLDHIAIRVKDLETSASWYEKILGLERKQLPEWGDFPIFMLAGKSGIALFPAKLEDPIHDPASRNVKIDHFAFQVNKSNFDAARLYFEEIDVPYNLQDHHYFHSIYLRDPDGHQVELTCLVVDEMEFYT